VVTVQLVVIALIHAGCAEGTMTPDRSFERVPRNPGVPDPIPSSPDGGHTRVDASVAFECTPLDPATLTPCCMAQGGAAHCVDEAHVPPSMRGRLEACPSGGFCLMDPLIRGEGVTARTCASIGGNPGACVSRCFPEVEENEGVLPQDVCDATERCAPCVNPLTDEPTGICEDTPPMECGASGAAPGDADPPPAPAPPPAPCCMGRATCVPESVVPADQRGQLGQDTCEPMRLCVPNEFIADPAHIPPSCTVSWAALFGGDGRGACLSDCFPAVRDEAFLSQEDCMPGYKCAPCTDPLSGMPTGACRE
jgi:hypothetical protein